MNVVDQLTPQQVRANAEEWFRRQCELGERALGSFWPQHRAWVEAYLKEEIRQRLVARGWRPK